MPSHTDAVAGLLAAEHPRFTDAEFARRRAVLETLMEQNGVTQLLVYGASRTGSAVQWLTGWPVTAEAAIVVAPGERDIMFAQYFNHLPLARKMARDAEIRWGGPSTIGAVVAELGRRLGGPTGRLGILGPVGYKMHGALVDLAGSVVDLGPAYGAVRLNKSDEEINWLRVGAAFSDLGVAGLREQARAGHTEHQLADIVERSYVPLGGATHIHYLGATSMDAPGVAVPRQFTSGHKISKGDVVTAELSAAFWGYAGQVLRSFIVGAAPTPLYRDLMGVAENAFEAITGKIRPGVHVQALVDAAGLIGEAGFTTIDDVVHGYGGGYLPPVLSAPGRADNTVPDMKLTEGMVLVVQPNVVTLDEKAGVQTGELGIVTKTGFESLHHAPRGFLEIEGGN